MQGGAKSNINGQIQEKIGRGNLKIRWYLPFTLEWDFFVIYIEHPPYSLPFLFTQVWQEILLQGKNFKNWFALWNLKFVGRLFIDDYSSQLDTH